MEPMEAVMVLILTVLLMFVVMSPATWGSASSSSAGAGQGEQYGHPSSCIATNLEFVFSPLPPCTPFSVFEEESASCNNNSTSLPSDNAVSRSGEPEQHEPEQHPADDPVSPSCAPECG